MEAVGYRKGLESREAILEEAGKVVLSRGFDATSFADVCEALEISRGKLTHHFPTKEALFEAITAHRFDRFRTRVIAPLRDVSLAPEARISASFAVLRTIYVEPDRVPGCYIGHTAMDIASRTPAMFDQLSRLLADWRAAVADVLVELGRSPEAAARQGYLTVSAVQGAVLMARAQSDRAALCETMDEMERTLLAGVPVAAGA